MSAPSGEQWEIAHGDQVATVVEVGGGLRTYDVGGRDVIEPYDVGSMSDGGHGAPLVPWPNRLEDGRYTFDGVDHQVALTEPDKGNAIHGLLRWSPWQLVVRDAAHVVVGARIHPQSGYPFDLSVRIEYGLDDDGLTVTTTATNEGTTALPYASGQHPYLSPGEGTIDACTLTLAAATRITTGPVRQLPSGTEAVAGSAHDFSGGRPLDGLQVDDAFTDLVREPDGLAWARLAAPDGRTAELWQDGSYPVMQVFTGDTLAPVRRRHGLAVEPMTAAANAFRSGARLQRLQPGKSSVSRWGARLR